MPVEGKGSALQFTMENKVEKILSDIWVPCTCTLTSICAHPRHVCWTPCACFLKRRVDMGAHAIDAKGLRLGHLRMRRHDAQTPSCGTMDRMFIFCLVALQRPGDSNKCQWERGVQ